MADHPVDVVADSNDYRAISTSGVLSLGLGVLSFTALIFPLFWIFPVLGFLLALLSLRRIGKSDSHLTGRRVAVAGLLLSLLFGSMATTRYSMRQFIINNQAEDFATLWFTLFQEGSLLKAHQLSMDPKFRLRDDVLLNEQYENDVTLKETLNKFVEEELIKTLVTQQDRATYRLVANLDQIRDEQVIRIRQLYQISFSDNGVTKVVRFELTIRCQFDKLSNQTYWTIADYQEAS